MASELHSVVTGKEMMGRDNIRRTERKVDDAEEERCHYFRPLAVRFWPLRDQSDSEYLRQIHPIWFIRDTVKSVL